MVEGPFVLEEGRLYEDKVQESGRRLSWGPWDELLAMEVSKLERIAHNEVDEGYGESPERRVVVRYAFKGQAVFSERRRLGVITLEGTKLHPGPINLYIAEGTPEDDGSHLWYWPPSDSDRRGPADGEGEMHIDIYLAKERITWLWQQIMHRPEARVILHIRAMIYQWEVDRFLSEREFRQDHFLFDNDPENQFSKPKADIRQVSFVIRDPLPTTTQEMDQFGDVIEVPVPNQIEKSEMMAWPETKPFPTTSGHGVAHWTTHSVCHFSETISSMRRPIGSISTAIWSSRSSRT